MRLVKGMDPGRTAQYVIDHIRKQGFFVVDQEPGAEVRMAHPKVAMVVIRGGEAAIRPPVDLPISQEVIRTVESARGPSVKLPNMGGSLPLLSVERPLGTRTILIPIGNHDNNQHSYNENLRLQNLWDGIELMAALLTMQGTWSGGCEYFCARAEAFDHLFPGISAGRKGSAALSPNRGWAPIWAGFAHWPGWHTMVP